MARRARRNHDSAFKAKVALVAIRGEKTLSELAQQFDVQANGLVAAIPKLLILPRFMHSRLADMA